MRYWGQPEVCHQQPVKAHLSANFCRTTTAWCATWVPMNASKYERRSDSQPATAHFAGAQPDASDLRDARTCTALDYEPRAQVFDDQV
jgi:hypothetical protein